MQKSSVYKRSVGPQWVCSCIILILTGLKIEGQHIECLCHAHLYIKFHKEKQKAIMVSIHAVSFIYVPFFTVQVDFFLPMYTESRAHLHP